MESDHQKGKREVQSSQPKKKCGGSQRDLGVQKQKTSIIALGGWDRGKVAFHVDAEKGGRAGLAQARGGIGNADCSPLGLKGEVGKRGKRLKAYREERFLPGWGLAGRSTLRYCVSGLNFRAERAGEGQKKDQLRCQVRVSKEKPALPRLRKKRKNALARPRPAPKPASFHTKQK